MLIAMLETFFDGSSGGKSSYQSNLSILAMKNELHLDIDVFGVPCL